MSPEWTIENDVEFYDFITVVYFSITCLSTVGYGDLVPHSATELAVVLLLLITFLPIFPWVVGEASTVLLKFNVRENQYVMTPNSHT